MSVLKNQLLLESCYLWDSLVCSSFVFDVKYKQYNHNYQFLKIVTFYHLYLTNLNNKLLQTEEPYK